MRRLLCCCTVILLGSLHAYSQTPANRPAESRKYRAILTPAGAGGGFALGLLVGLNKYDDAVNSDRKVWTAALASAGGGAVGGYFLGRFLDKKRQARQPVSLAPQLSREEVGVSIVMRF